MRSISRAVSRFGINVGVLVVSIAVFLLAFFGLQMYAGSQQPPKTEILTAARTLQIGDVVKPRDLKTMTVFEDQATSAYLPASAITDTVGGVVRMPVAAGQPLLGQSVLAASTAQTRLSSVLADEPDMSLMPLPLDLNNVVAPPLDAYLPGDYVDVTVVIDRRPQRFDEEQAQSTPGRPAAVPAQQPVVERDTYETLRAEPIVADALDRLRPPVAKSLFPRGARIMAIYGLPPEPAGQPADGTGEAESEVVLPPPGSEQEPLLVLLVPSEQRERFGLALQRGDLVVVSLLGRIDEEPRQTPGFTYDDLELWLEYQRLETFEEQLGGSDDGTSDLFDVTGTVVTGTTALTGTTAPGGDGSVETNPGE